ncbi:hypothetical protein BMETH_23891852409, partial [methanotrophic bacterial endosymbiont of Bathymodiolus sp.]
NDSGALTAVKLSDPVHSTSLLLMPMAR